VSPPDSTERLAGRLSGQPGVGNLVVLRGAARNPFGDVLQFDLRSAFANQMLAELHAMPLTEGGPVSVEQVAAVGSGSAAEAGARKSPRVRYGETVPVWEVIEAKIRADGGYPPSFFILLVSAGLIGACGILTNSQILIVAAMVVGPEYGVIMATALGCTKKDLRAVRGGLLGLLSGFALAVAATFLFGLAIRGLGHTPALYGHGVRPVSDLINSPNLFSVVVAVLAGAVGVVSLAASRANALIGVFISVTTIPAAADMGLSAAYASWPEARGSTLQLLLNVTVLIAVGAGGLWLQRFVWRKVLAT
jgi:uncharacterized hydrophobic protein (TIGR00271 family)